MSTITFSASNPAIAGAVAMLYQNTSATLDLVLTNGTGSDITLTAGGAGASTFLLFLPDDFATEELKAVTVAAPAGWSAGAFDATDLCWTLTYAGTTGDLWSDDAALTTTLGSVETTAQPGLGRIQFLLSGLSGNYPDSVETKLAVSPAPVAGNRDLTAVLQVALVDPGLVYVSTASDPLANTLVLTFSNTGATPLYNGTGPWPASDPTVAVAFVYGTDAGAIGPCDLPPPAAGSALNIKAAVLAAQNNTWQVKNPSSDLPAAKAPPPHPVADPHWQFLPLSQTPGILGLGDSSSISIQFTDIVSLTDIGVTQMYLYFSNFYADDTTAYDDAVYVLNINKQSPPQRGSTSFYADQNTVAVFSPSPDFTVNLNWSLYGVASINVYIGGTEAPVHTASYEAASDVVYDNCALSVTPLSGTYLLSYTLECLDGTGTVLNKAYAEVTVEGNFVIDPRDGQCYSTLVIGDLRWMTQNMNHQVDGAVYLNNDPNNAAQYGLLYTKEQTLGLGFDNWRLPSSIDFNNLISAKPGSSPTDYLIGGAVGFNAAYAGAAQICTPFPIEFFPADWHFGVLYWSSDPATSVNYLCMAIDDNVIGVSDVSITCIQYFSVRLCMDVSQT